jgi:hypothetical protein
MESANILSKEEKTSKSIESESRPAQVNSNRTNRYSVPDTQRILEDALSEYTQEEEPKNKQSDYIKQVMDEDVYQESSPPSNDTSKFKRNSVNQHRQENQMLRENFYMNAPCQIDINKIRQKVDLPPVSSSPDEILAVPHRKQYQSNSSKLMEQLQRKEREAKQMKTPSSRLIQHKSKQGFFVPHSKKSLVLNSRQHPHSIRHKAGSGADSALSKYSENGSHANEDENAVFLEHTGSNSKQFLTFTAPTPKRKEHKKNRSVGSKENICIQDPNVNYRLNFENEGCVQNLVEDPQMKNYHTQSYAPVE